MSESNAAPDNASRKPGADIKTPRTPSSLPARLLLLLVTAVLALVGVEIGFRVYYALSNAPLYDLEADNETLWKQKWIDEHQGKDVDHFKGSDEYDPKLGWKPRPNLRNARLDGLAPVSTNSRGWRNPRDFPFDKPPGLKRMVLLGDSFTYGEQEEDDHVWPAVLQEALPK
ncbi:MAG: hypothetical protein JXQ73_15675 [Phycisphaerae bacterium]|nr:hypothetical protein [Phycisphaerae bacterium]